MKENSRREFIKKGTTVAFLYAIFNPFSLFADEKVALKTPSWIELVDYARWSPTVHNLQPHKLKIISDTEAELYYDPKRLLPVGDPNAKFATVAMGIFIENLSIAASCKGFKVIISEIINPISNDKTENTIFLKLQIVPKNSFEKLDRELIKTRRTSRLQYDKKQINKDILENIKKETNLFDHDFSYTSDIEVVDFIVDLNQKTLFEDLKDKNNREELDGLFRYSLEEAESHKDGLWAKCMGFPGFLMKNVFHHHEKWNIGFRKTLLTKFYKSSFKGTSTICWFSGKFENTTDWLIAGKMFSRSWLLFTENNIYIHPFGSLITNLEANNEIQKKIVSSNENAKIWLIFRAGYSTEPTRSFRLNTSEIII